MVYDVTVYGASNDGSADASPGIQAAIAAAEAAGGGIVYFPTGLYRIESQLRVQADGVVLAGAGRSSVILHKPASGGSPFLPVLFQKGTSAGANPGELKDVGIRDLTVKFDAAGPQDAGAVQMNGCVDWFCERVTVLGDRNGMNSSRTNGIAAAFGSRDGIISGCVVDGVSKPAFYLASAERVTVVGCVAKHIRRGALHSGVGFATGQGRHVSFVDCHAHDCDDNGFHISNIGTLTGEIQSSPAPTSTSFRVLMGGDYGSRMMEALGVWKASTTRFEELRVASVTHAGGDLWDITLAAASSVTLSAGVTIHANFRPYRGVTIVGGSSTKNGAAGISIGTNLVGMIGRDLLINGVTCADNAAQGIFVSSVEDLVIQGCILRGNQLGLGISDIGPGQGGENLTGRVLVHGCIVYDNSRMGVQVRSANDVTVESTRIYRTSSGYHLDGGLVISDYSVITANKKTTDLKLRAIDFSGHATLAIVHIDGIDSAVESGYYSLLLAGAPEGVHYAPAGSEYTDRASGLKYRKATGFGSTGWTLM